MANANIFTTPTLTKINRVDSERPSNNIRTDMVDHLTDFNDKTIATRCKYTNCKKRTHIFCSECKIPQNKFFFFFTINENSGLKWELLKIKTLRIIIKKKNQSN